MYKFSGEFACEKITLGYFWANFDWPLGYFCFTDLATLAWTHPLALYGLTEIHYFKNLHLKKGILIWDGN